MTGPQMPLIDGVRMAVESLRQYRMQSLLSVLALSLGTFSIAIMLSLSDLAAHAIVSQFSAVAGNSVFVQQDVANRGQFSLNLNQRDVAFLSGLYGVRAVPRIAETVLYQSPTNTVSTVTLNGSPGDLPKIDSTVSVREGRYFSAFEATSAEAVGVLNDQAVRELFGRRDPLGQRVTLRYLNGAPVRVTVIGVLAPAPGVFQALGTPQVLVPNQLIWRVSPTTRKGDFDAIELLLRPDASADEAATQVQHWLDKLHGPHKFSAQSLNIFLELIASVKRVLEAVFGALGLLAILGSGLGVMNVMLSAVTERMQEIGLLMALGATSQVINRQFLLEAFLLAALGSAAGLVAADLLIALLVLLVPALGPNILNLRVTLISVGITLFSGLFFGVIPAAKASSLDPMVCLRHD